MVLNKLCVKPQCPPWLTLLQGGTEDLHKGHRVMT